MTLGFAIVGCGMIARFHARALKEVPGARLLALVSRNPANAERLAKSLDLACDIYTDLEQALARPDTNVVIVTTPSGAHLEPAVAAARAGKHVVVEKPLEITLDRCDQIIEACDRNRVQPVHHISVALRRCKPAAEVSGRRRPLRPSDAR